MLTKQDLIDFEDDMRILWESGQIHCPHHFCGGNEDILINYFQKNVSPNDWVFSTHRNAYHWLLHTGDKNFLRTEILKRNNSMHIIDVHRRFISTAIVGGNVGLAVGVAKAIKLAGQSNKVHCFVGDGACDQGWFWEALRYAIGHDLPITFVIENNNRSVTTTIEQRWGEKDREMQELWDTPKVFYYHYTPIFPHVGTGVQIKW